MINEPIYVTDEMITEEKLIMKENEFIEDALEEFKGMLDDHLDCLDFDAPTDAESRSARMIYLRELRWFVNVEYHRILETEENIGG